MRKRDWPYPVAYQTAAVMDLRPIFEPMFRAPRWQPGSYGQWLLDRISLLHRENVDAAEAREYPRPDPYEPPSWVRRLGDWLTCGAAAAPEGSAA